MNSTISQSDPEEQIGVLLQQGMQAAQQGDTVRADRLFQAVLEKDPDHEEAWLWRAALAESPDQSVVYLQRVLAINPDNTRAQAGLRWAREQMEAAERLSQAPSKPAWGGVVALAPVESEGAQWQWWHVAVLFGVVLLTGALLCWRSSRILELVGLLGPQATATVCMPAAGSPVPDVGLVPAATAIPTTTPSPLPPSPLPSTATAVPPVSPSPVSPTASAVPPATSSPLPPTATIIPTTTPSPYPTLATVWPTPGPTGPPVVTPRPTGVPSSS